MQQPDVYIVIPSYNEAPEVLRNTVQELISFYPNYKILVVDDGSETSIASSLRDLPVIIIRHAVNLGQGAALQTASAYLLKLKKDLIAVHFDADGQHDISNVETLLLPIRENKADIVLGSRFLQGSEVGSIPAFRSFLLTFGSLFNNLLTGMKLTDTHNGLRALNHCALEKIQLTQNRFAHATELISLIRKHRLRYCEVPVHIRYTAYSLKKGQHSLGAINILYDLFIKKIIK